MTAVIILAAAAVVVCGYLLCLKPNTKRREQMKPFEEVYIAHRGLFDNHSKAPENSLAAFQKAVQAGYGIELDVQMTADHQMVVFHDASLKRMCGADLRLTDLTWQELKRYRLADSDETIPLFRDVLNIIDGKVPVIVEIKVQNRYLETTRYLARIMDHYQGVYCIESFHPLAVAWFRRHRPEVIRGQLSTNYRKDHIRQPAPVRFILTNLLFNGYSRPDFIAYNYKFSSQFSYRLCRRLYSIENAAWTIHSQEALNQAKEVFQIFIFDSFIPEK